MEGLAAYYQSPGRLAGLRRRFESAFRQPGLDPATFATDLGMLAIQGFGDMREQARDTMIRDKFIAGQEQCALRRQLDGFAQGTPIGEIVDSCHVWESHSDSNWVAKKGYDSEVGNQSGDSRTRERRKVGVVIEEREPEIEGWKQIWEQELSGIFKKWLGQNGGTPTGGSTCRWEENVAPTVDRSPRVGMVNFEHVRLGRPNWVHGRDPVETHYSQKQRRSPGNERRFGRVGQPLGPLRIKAPLTLGGGGGSLPIKERVPLGRRRKMMGVAANGRWMIRNSQSWGRRRRPERPSDRLIPETPWDSIQNEVATIGTAKPIEIRKPVAMADVAVPRGPAGTGAGGPVITEISMTTVTDRTEASGPRRSETGAPVVTELRSQTGNDRTEASGPAVTVAGGSVSVAKKFRPAGEIAETGVMTGTGTGGPVVAGTRFLAVAEVHAPVHALELLKTLSGQN